MESFHHSRKAEVAKKEFIANNSILNTQEKRKPPNKLIAWLNL